MPRSLARLCCVALVPLAAGCASASAAAVDPGPASAMPSTSAPPSHVPGPPVLVSTDGPPARWKEPARGGTPPPHPLSLAHLVAAGKKLALVRAHAGFFSVHESRGVEGPLPLPPETVWMGLDGDDALYAASREGALSRADSLESALSGKGWKPRASIASVTGWDATVGLVVAASPQGVHVSTDRGATFRVVSPGVAVHAVVARPDGVLVASAKDEATPPQISIDKGKTWRASTTRASKLHRVGGLVSALLPCPVVLAKDGATWLAASPDVELAGRAWERSVDVTALVEAYVREPRASALVPAAPDPKSAPPAPASCDAPAATGKVRAGQSVADGPRCAHAECLRGTTEPPPDPTRREASLLGAATCERGAPGEPCPNDAPRSHEPSILLADLEAQTIHVTRAPDGCRPHRVLSAGGLSLLACASDASTPLFAADASGALHPEGDLPVSASDLGAMALASDGTVLLRTAWDREAQRRAFVRAPSPEGSPAAWREIALAGVVEVRVLTAGQVLVVGVAQSGGLSLSVDALGGRKVLVPEVPLEGHAVDVSVVDGRVVVWTLPTMRRGRVPPGTPAARGAAQPFYVTASGALEPYPAALPR